MKTKQIIEAEHLYKEFRENLRRLATLMILVGIGLMIIGIIKGICEKVASVKQLNYLDQEVSKV